MCYQFSVFNGDRTSCLTHYCLLQLCSTCAMARASSSTRRFVSLMQCVAVCCSALQCVAVRCSVVWCVVVCRIALQCVVMCCVAVQCVAVCCSVLQCVLPQSCSTCATGRASSWMVGVLQCVIVCCSVLQCVATCCSVFTRNHAAHSQQAGCPLRLAGSWVRCSVLHCVALCCTVLRCVAVRCSVSLTRRFVIVL